MPQAMSPRTQQMQLQQGAGLDQQTEMFEQGFSQMAYNVLLAKHPDLMESIVTFKVLTTDTDEGKGVGAFVLQRQGRPLYVPVVMADSQIKPLDIIYDKKLNIFLPLTKGWLEEMDKISLEEMGSGIKTPETLYTDVDIRNIVVPPITGRFSYAEYIAGIEKTAHTPELRLLHFLDQAPNSVKLAFTSFLERYPRLMKKTAAVYGVKPLVEALRPRAEKTAAKQLFGGALWIADRDTTPTEFKRIFGAQAGEAFTGVRLKGYAAKDTRMGLNRAVQQQAYSRLTEPASPGVYTLYTLEGEEVPALVVENALNLFARPGVYSRSPVVPGHTPATSRVYPEGRPDDAEFINRPTSKRFLALFGDGRWLETDRLVGRENVADSIDGSTLHTRLFNAAKGAPRAGYGCFIRARGTSIEATTPLYINSVSEGEGGVRRIAISEYKRYFNDSAPTGHGHGEKTLVVDPKHRVGTVQMARKSPIVMFPDDFIWIPLKSRDDNGARSPREFFQSPFDANTLVTNALTSVGVKPGAVKSAGQGMFAVDGRIQTKVAAIRDIATRYYVPWDEAEALVEKAASEARVTFYATSVTKLAQAQMLIGRGKTAADAPPADMAQDPNAAAMQPPAPPPPPSPTDLAAMEMQQQIDAEMRKLQEKAQMLAALTQRTQEIAGGAPVMPTVQTQAMGAPPPSMNLATGAPTMAQPMAATDPNAMGVMADPAAMGQQGMAPPGASMPPQDPSMMGGAPGMPQDPSMMGQPQQPPMAMMSETGLNASTADQQINPQFLDQAGQLQANDVFDAAAVASLAQSPAVREMVGQYVPNLEKALDNLGRVLLTLWMQEGDLKQQIGEEAYAQLEDRLRTTFSNLGDLVLSLNQTAHVIPGKGGRGLA